MTRDQIKHLKERISAAYQKHNPWGRADEPDPPEVSKARRVIKAWEDKRSRKHQALTDRVKDARREAEQALHFSDEKKALAAVQKFERAKF